MTTITDENLDNFKVSPQKSDNKIPKESEIMIDIKAVEGTEQATIYNILKKDKSNSVNSSEVVEEEIVRSIVSHDKVESENVSDNKLQKNSDIEKGETKKVETLTDIKVTKGINVEEQNKERSIEKNHSKNVVKKEFSSNSTNQSFFKHKKKPLKNQESNFWIHRVDSNILKRINNKQILGAKSKKSKLIDKIKEEDRIILVTNVGNGLQFVAYTQVKCIQKNNEELYDVYKSTKKLVLKGIKYFSSPIPLTKIKDDLNFIEDKKKAAQYFKSEYRKLSHSDFSKIYSESKLVDVFPAYLQEVSLSQSEFILITLQELHALIKKITGVKQIEIIKFLDLLQEILRSYGVTKSNKELKEFYAIHAIDLGFNHLPSRDPDLQIGLQNSSGKLRNFSYIKFRD